MEQDLDGHNQPEDVNPSAITRLYICVDCAIEIGRMMIGSRGYEINRMGELALAQNVARELAERIDDLETKLENIASAIYGMDKPAEEPVESIIPTDGEVPAPDPAQSESSLPLARKRGLPRRKEPLQVNTDFLGDL
jgi:hypothetical protein